MGWLIKQLFLIMLMFHVIVCQLCRDDQSYALLQVKHAFTVDESASSGCELSVANTNSWSSTTDCCKWNGVTCDESTGNVVEVDLSCSQLSGVLDSNSTIFQLTHLQSLNLAYNDFTLSKIPNELGHFASLMHLNLSSAGFTGVVPSEISRLSRLISLDLSLNLEGLKLKPQTFKQLLKNLTQLRELHLPNVVIDSVMPRNISSSLRILNLGDTGLHGNFPDSIFESPQLESLVLASNFDLKGRLPRTTWNSSKSLKKLDVSLTSFSGDLPDSLGSLESLTYLDLSSCNFTSSIPESLGNLTRLENLILFSNNLGGNVPPTLANLDRLTRLDFSSNNLTGEIPDFFDRFRELKDLSLADNFFTGEFPGSVTTLTKLESLDLSNTSMIGRIPPEVTGFQSLILLFLKENKLSGEIPLWVFDLPSLKYLDMRSNNLSGQIEPFDSPLEYIDLSENRLHGGIPSSISKLVNLTTLHLSSNDLSGDLDVSIFSGLKRLRRLGLSHNSLSLSSVSKDVALPESLDTLWLSSCNITDFDFLSETKLLGKLDLSRNKIREIPDWALSNWASSVFYLNLSFNSLTKIKNLNRFENLVYLDLGSNSIHGSLPVPSPTTQIFFAPNNDLTGELPRSMCNLTSLVVLDVSNNSLSGVIPRCLSRISTLSVMDMHSNRFQGTIGLDFGSGNHLRTLNLHDNRLEGTVPRSLTKCKELEVLDLGKNNLNGTFPEWLGNLPKLQVLSLRSNRLNGPVSMNTSHSKAQFPEVKIIDLSRNEFSGTLDFRLFSKFRAMMGSYKTESSLKYIGETFYQDTLTVMIKGQDIKLVRVLTILTTIDLSSNRFEGEIPISIGMLTSLRGLNLSHNSLTGHIPTSLGDLSVLESLDLSSNQLDGTIPGDLTGLTFLSVLNLSQNRLQGKIPQGNQFNTFQGDSYAGNDGLCGLPLSEKCENAEIPVINLPDYDDDEDEFMHGFSWRSVLIGFGVGIFPGLYIGNLMFFPVLRTKWVKNLFIKRK